MTKYIWLFLEIVSTIAVIIIIRSRIQAKAVQALETKDFEAYRKMSNKFWFKLLFAPSFRSSMDLFAALNEKDDKKIKLAYKGAFAKAGSTKGRKQLGMQMLNYAIIKHDAKFADEIIQDIDLLKDPEFSKEALILNKIYLKKDTGYIETMEEEFNRDDVLEPRKFELASLLYAQYDTLNSKGKKAYYAAYLKK